MKRKFSVLYFLFGFLICLNIFLGFNNKGRVFADKQKISSNAKAAILLDADSGTVIYSKNEKEKLPIASMCKIMTLLICYENIEDEVIGYEEEITVSKNAASMGGSQVFLEENCKYKIKDLIKSISVASANDSCVAIAERICGDESTFVEKMNEKCQELGMTNTKFSNCTGLPKPDQYSCAYDVSIMFRELIKHNDYFSISNIWNEDFIHSGGRVTQMTNTNKLIRFYNGCDCGKTGYTSEAGHCLTASAKRNGLRLIAVEINAPDSKTRFKDVSEMFNYGFNNFTNKLIVDETKPLDLTVNVNNGKKEEIKVKANKSFYLFSSKEQKRSVEINFTPAEKIKAPIYEGDSVGKLYLYENGIVIAEIEVISLENVDKKGYFDAIFDITENFGVI